MTYCKTQDYKTKRDGKTLLSNTQLKASISVK